MFINYSIFLFPIIDTRYPEYIQKIIEIKLIIYISVLSNKLTAIIPRIIDVNVVISNFSFFLNDPSDLL